MHRLTADFLAYLGTLTRQERYEVLLDIRYAYCWHCGGPAKCNCWNDE